MKTIKMKTNRQLVTSFSTLSKPLLKNVPPHRGVLKAATQQQNKSLGAQVFGTEEWEELRQSSSSSTVENRESIQPFQFRNRRGRLPSAVDDAIQKSERFGPELKPIHSFLFGKHPVELALKLLNPSSFSKLVLQEGSPHQLHLDSPIRALAKSKQVPIEISSKLRMDEVNPLHQGLLLDTLPFDYPELESDAYVKQQEGENEQQRVILCLDEFVDAKTLGAVLRSALFFRVSAVVVSVKNSSGLTPELCKASAGASIVLGYQQKLFGTTNLMRTLKTHHKRGWKIFGLPTNAQTLAKKRFADKDVFHVKNLKGHNKMILVCGQDGLRTLVADECRDGFVQLDYAMTPKLFLLPEVKPRLSEVPLPHIPLSLSTNIAALLSTLRQK